MKTLRGLGLFCLLVLACRGCLYRHIVTYQSVGQRLVYPATADKLLEYLNTPDTRLKNPDIQAIIQLSLSKTAGQLYFTAAKNDNDPNLLMYSKSANCIGYAAFFTTACNYFLKKNGLDAEWTVSPRIGQLYLLETNVHHWFRSPFFKDHDFVVLENRTTGAVWAVDPTVYDYGRIVLVTRR